MRSPRVRRLGSVAGSAAAIAAFAVPGITSATVVKAPHVRRPAARTYTGHAGRGRKLTLIVAGESVKIVSFQFVGCRRALGATSLDDIPLHKARTGYRFAIRAYGGVSYANSQLDDNAAISIKGQFDSRGRSVRGTLRVTSPGCGRTGLVRWSAKR